MSDQIQKEVTPADEGREEQISDRRLFLRGVGKWSGAAIVAAVAGIGVGTAPKAQGAWINRRGGWVNRGGSWANNVGGGGWVNRAGGGGWINRR